MIIENSFVTKSTSCYKKGTQLKSIQFVVFNLPFLYYYNLPDTGWQTILQLW